MPDIKIDDQGTIVLFTLLTDVAKDWFAENVQTESWQWLGDGLGVDHRMAGPLIEGLVEAGLELA